MITEGQLEQQCLCWFGDRGVLAVFGSDIAHDCAAPELISYPIAPKPSLAALRR